MTAVTGDRDKMCMRQASMQDSCSHHQSTDSLSSYLPIASCENIVCINKLDIMWYLNICFWLYKTAVTDDKAEKCPR